LNKVIGTNDKKRFSFSDDGTKIRASQGYSVKINLGSKEIKPPEYLYHGTVSKNVDSILENGLNKMDRNHVHLSFDKNTVINVGQRHRKPIVLVIMSGIMHGEGKKFYLSENGVYLVDSVDPKHIQFPT